MPYYISMASSIRDQFLLCLAQEGVFCYEVRILGSHIDQTFPQLQVVLWIQSEVAAGFRNAYEAYERRIQERSTSSAFRKIVAGRLDRHPVTGIQWEGDSGQKAVADLKVLHSEQNAQCMSLDQSVGEYRILRHVPVV